MTWSITGNLDVEYGTEQEQQAISELKTAAQGLPGVTAASYYSDSAGQVNLLESDEAPVAEEAGTDAAATDGGEATDGA